jgi:RHS repeat-associated protein
VIDAGTLAVVGRQWYTPFGAPRAVTGTLPTDRKFTGQRSEEATLGSLYDFGARFYSPSLNRWLQPDPTVPRPADPQSLNRYSYAANNPLRFVDPSGLAECAAGDQQCWISEWHWKNNWYSARGYFWGGSHWDDTSQAPSFANEQVTNEVIEDAGIKLAGGGWGWANKQKVAYGVALFGRKLVGGLKDPGGLRELLGGGATIDTGKGCFGSPCAPPWPIPSGNEVWLPLNLLNGYNNLGGWCCGCA